MTLLLGSLFMLASTTPKTQTQIQVCVSPGCKADGAVEALDKLKALCPPSVLVEPGKCESLCGKGPILVRNPDTKKQLLKYMKDDKLVKFVNELLTEDSADAEVPSSLVEGYELVRQGLEAIQKRRNNNHAEAIPLLRQGIDVATESAKAYGADLGWMAKAHCALAECLLAVRQKDEALEAIQTALVLSPEDGHAYDVLSQVCQAQKDNEGEYRALKALFDLPEDPNPPRAIANRRRELGFRFASLQRKIES